MKLQNAKGTRDINPEDKLLKNKVINTLQEVFELYGFAPLETPIIERYETLAAKFAAGEDSDAMKETFKLTDQGKRKLALRFDLTVPLARYVAMNPTLKMPFKRYAVGRVYRDGPIKLGRYREFWQMDADIIGTPSMLADAQCLAVLSTGFSKLNLDAVIKVNNRKILNGILEECGIKDKENAIIAIDKLEKIGQKGVLKELEERKIKNAKKIFEFIDEKTSLTQLQEKVQNKTAQEGIQELTEVFTYLNQLGINNVEFDISLARGLAYYTGTVTEAFLKDKSITSSIAGGGRYDNIIGSFLGGGRVVPAIGISYGIETIMDALRLKGEKAKQTPTQVLVVPLGTLNESLEIVATLRDAKIPADIVIGKKGVSKNLQYANALGIPYAIILGEDELAKKKVMLRDMQTGDEQLLGIKEVVKIVR